MYDESIAAYNRVIEIDPAYIDAYFNLGVSYGKKGLLDNEILQYRKVLDLNPNSAEAHFNLGIAYGERK